jgi:hypothetical protein
MYFSYDHLQLRYEPFPIGLAKPLMDEPTYQSMVDAYPPLELFQYIPKIGNKYCLSQKFHADKYHDFIRQHPVWRDFHAWIKSDAFASEVMQTLKERSVDLGFGKQVSASDRALKRLKNVLRGRPWQRAPWLTARFEFSMLPAAGGYVIPHTDERNKIVTIVVSMMREGEWDPAFGGGTDVNRPKDIRRNFNWMNDKAEFDDMEVIDTFDFTPNQAVIFVKTFNSWHSVRPMSGPKTGNGSAAMRKTLTINIEAHA